MENLLAVIGSRIRSSREFLGLSQETVAARADLNVSYLSQIERGKKEPSIAVLARVSAAVNLTLADLFDRQDMSADSLRNMEVARLLARVPHGKQTALLDLLRAAVDLASR